MITEKLFCRCGLNLGGADFDADGMVKCPECGVETKVSDSARVHQRALEKFRARADCCKDAANLSLKTDGMVKCSVCGARNLAEVA